MGSTVRTGEALLVETPRGPVEGWLMQPGCSRCGETRVYVLAYAATACPACNEWLELMCPEPDCLYCRCRPPRPWPAQREEASSRRAGP